MTTSSTSTATTGTDSSHYGSRNYTAMGEPSVISGSDVVTLSSQVSENHMMGQNVTDNADDEYDYGYFDDMPKGSDNEDNEDDEYNTEIGGSHSNSHFRWTEHN